MHFTRLSRRQTRSHRNAKESGREGNICIQRLLCCYYYAAMLLKDTGNDSSSGQVSYPDMRNKEVLNRQNHIVLMWIRMSLMNLLLSCVSVYLATNNLFLSPTLLLSSIVWDKRRYKSMRWPRKTSARLIWSNLTGNKGHSGRFVFLFGNASRIHRYRRAHIHWHGKTVWLHFPTFPR